MKIPRLVRVPARIAASATVALALSACRLAAGCATPARARRSPSPVGGGALNDRAERTDPGDHCQPGGPMLSEPGSTPRGYDIIGLMPSATRRERSRRHWSATMACSRCVPGRLRRWACNAWYSRCRRRPTGLDAAAPAGGRSTGALDAADAGVRCAGQPGDSSGQVAASTQAGRSAPAAAALRHSVTTIPTSACSTALPPSRPAPHNNGRAGRV
jgi:hypothetical protein